MLTQLILGRSESVRASGDDLSNYLYLIRHLEAWKPRNCFGKPILGSKLPDLGLIPDEQYFPAFTVLCMGDTNGVDIAQATHESVLEAAGCLKNSQKLVYGRVFPCSRTLEGLYIDDHVTFQAVDKKPTRERTTQEDEILASSARKRYEELGLPRSLKKAFDKQYEFKAWGTSVSSASGWVGAPIAKLRQIEALTAALLEMGRTTKEAMQKLVGLFVRPYMHRRECMCAFHHTYLERMPETSTVNPPHHVRDELFLASLLLPLAFSSARWPVSVQISASDASAAGGGRTSTLTSKAFAKALYRFGEKRGEYTRLDWDSLAIPPPTCMQPAPKCLTDTTKA